MWVAREESGRLFLFESKPIKNVKCPGLWVNDNVTTPIMEIDANLFPYVTWEDEPIEVKLYSDVEISEIKSDSYKDGYDSGYDACLDNEF